MANDMNEAVQDMANDMNEAVQDMANDSTSKNAKENRKPFKERVADSIEDAKDYYDYVVHYADKSIKIKAGATAVLMLGIVIGVLQILFKFKHLFRVIGDYIYARIVCDNASEQAAKDLARVNVTYWSVMIKTAFSIILLILFVVVCSIAFLVLKKILKKDYDYE